MDYNGGHGHNGSEQTMLRKGEEFKITSRRRRLATVNAPADCGHEMDRTRSIITDCSERSYMKSSSFFGGIFCGFFSKKNSWADAQNAPQTTNLPVLWHAALMHQGLPGLDFRQSSHLAAAAVLYSMDDRANKVVHGCDGTRHTSRSLHDTQASRSTCVSNTSHGQLQYLRHYRVHYDKGVYSTQGCLRNSVMSASCSDYTIGRQLRMLLLIALSNVGYLHAFHC